MWIRDSPLSSTLLTSSLSISIRFLQNISFYHLKNFIYFTIPFYNSLNIPILIFYITPKFHLIFLFSFFLIVSLFTTLSFPHHFSLFTHNQYQSQPPQSKPTNKQLNVSQTNVSPSILLVASCNLWQWPQCISFFLHNFLYANQ